MQRRSFIPKAELLSAVVLVALCAATVFQLVRIQPHVADPCLDRPSAHAPRYSKRETWPIIRVDSDRRPRQVQRDIPIGTGDPGIVGGHDRQRLAHDDSCDLARAADAFGALALVPDTRVSGWLSR